VVTIAWIGWSLSVEYTKEKCPTQNPSFKLKKVDNERKRYLSQEEAERLLSIIKNKNYQTYEMSIVALDAGLRFGEIAALQWSSIDFDNEIIHILNTKSGKDRSVPMTSRLYNILKNKPKEQELVFPNKKGGRHKQVPSSFKRACQISTLNDNSTDQKHRISFHGLRHTFASRLIQSGVDLYRVQKLLGHGTPNVTQRYSHLANEDLRSGIKSMENKYC